MRAELPSCDLCGQDALHFAYQPERSTRDLKVHVCGHCGLVQSLPRIDRTPARHGAAVSGGADWGNVRYGKGFRTEAALAALARHAKFDGALSLLDVGSNRGSFAKAFLDTAPKANVTAVEPDERYADSCAELPRTRLIWARTEETNFPDASFDIVHSCHTIEHLAQPFVALKDHARVLKQGGLLVLDAPNIALIGGDDILEEWFIDKHLYHFSKATLTRMIEAAGFTILAEPDPSDLTNLLLVARKTRAWSPNIAPDLVEVARAQALIQRYRGTRAANRTALVAAARELNALKPQRIALWGAGRLFDSLVLAGGFDPKGLSLLIDAHLIQYMPERHGVALSKPEALRSMPVDVIVAMSRAFSDEITAEAKRLAPNARVILYADLLARARLSHAA
ncbi:MAG TPA: class I SAM-dependent methyltransferase [Rhizomicrobium sp.]|nr:class I SAM-dependent methyltransferase [Rhizomicrobium sp.]